MSADSSSSPISTAKDFTREKPDSFKAALGASLSQVLDLQAWTDGHNLGELYGAQSTLIAECVERERRTREPIRRKVFPRVRELAKRSGIESGPYGVSEEELESARRH